MNQFRPNPSTNDQPSSQIWLHAVAVCLWLLIVVTFTRPGRHEVSATEGLDWIAAAKLGSRGIAFIILAIAAIQLWGCRGWTLSVRDLLPIGLFAAWGLLSVAWSPKPSLSLAQAGCFAILVLMAGVTALVVRTERDLSVCLAHISLALMTVSTILVIAKLARIGGLERTDAGGGTAGILHPTVAASTASLGILLLAGIRLWWDWRWVRFAVLPGLAVHMAVIVISNTRLALALTALMVVAMLMIALPRYLVLGSVLLVATLVPSYLAYDANLEVGRQGARQLWEYTRRGQSTRELSGLSGRDEIWPLMGKSFLESPVWGHGFYVTSSQGKMRVWHSKGNFSAHNIGLQVLVTTGLVGLALFVWGLARPLRAFFRCQFLDTDGARLQWLLGAIWIWYFGWGMLNASFAAPFQPEAVVFFALLGVAQAKTTDYLESADETLDIVSVNHAAMLFTLNPSR